MDCKVWLSPEVSTIVTGVGNVKPIPHVVVHPGTDTIAPANIGRLQVIIYGDDSDTHPIAQFYDAIGYELIGQRQTGARA